METLEKKGKGSALLPFLLFIVIYLGAGLYFQAQGVEMAFYQFPSVTAMFIALLLAFCQGKGTIDQKFTVFAKGAANENVLTMLMIYILAGAFSTVASAMGGVDATVNLGLSVIPVHFLAAGVFTKERQTAVPYESVFTGDERIMMGDARDDVVARFLEDGFQVNPDLHEPEDHLAFELEYLVDMNERAAAWAQAKDKAELRRNVVRQLEFIERHLLNWIPELREVAQEYATLAFYPGMLLVAQGALEQGSDLLRSILAQLDGTSAAA